MFEQDIIVKDSDKKFRLRIGRELRIIGVYQIIGTKEYLDIEFVGGDSIRILYPHKFSDLINTVESELLLETQLSSKQIGIIISYIREYIDQIESITNKMKQSLPDSAHP